MCTPHQYQSCGEMCGPELFKGFCIPLSIQSYVMVVWYTQWKLIIASLSGI